MANKKLSRKFYLVDGITLAKKLLGKYIVRKLDSRKFIGKIVETEAYIGPKDKASHSFGGKITPRNQAEYLEGGHIYIYLCYGMYWQLNITANKNGKPECVLIRAVEPINYSSKLKIKNVKLLRKLTSGPGKLCQWMKLNKSFNTEDLTKSKRIWIEDRGEKIKSSQIVKAKRIGIDYAGNFWKNKLWRFYIKDNPFVSKK